MLLKIKDQRGFTLIEAMGSAVILGIIVISFLSFSEYSLLASRNSNQTIEAQRIAEEQLNITRLYIENHNALPINPIVAGYEVFLQHADFVDNPPTYITTSFQSKHYSLQAVVLINSAPRLLTVTVSWSGA